jgi:glycosyltransferase involved in cell wall biosynthesis
MPPPRGGVSTHLERLLPYLEEAGLPYVVWDYSTIPKERDRLVSLRREPWKALQSYLEPTHKILYHPLSQVTPGKIFVLLLMRLMGTRLILMLAASPEQTLGGSRLKRLGLLALARVSSQIVAANGEFRRVLTEWRIDANKISVIPPFIPQKDAFAKEPSLSPEAERFCKDRSPLILTYANGPDIHEGQDLYGLDLIIELAKRLRDGRPDVGFVVVIPEVTNSRYFLEYRSTVRQAGLDPLFHFAIGNRVSFLRFLPYTDVFVRATNTDGDALTLREALYYNVSSVATDISHRPEGTILFHNRDAGDLCRAIEEALRMEKKGSVMETINGCNHATRFLDIFRRVANLRDG